MFLHQKHLEKSEESKINTMRGKIDFKIPFNSKQKRKTLIKAHDFPVVDIVNYVQCSHRVCLSVWVQFKFM